MALSADDKKALNKIESEMARKGFALGDVLDAALVGIDVSLASVDTQFTELDTPTPSADPGDAGSLSATAKLEEIVSAGAESRVLPAPPAGFVGRKVIRFKTDGGNVTIAGTNVLTKEILTYTMTAVDDTIVLVGNGGDKWIEVGTNLTAA